MPTELRPPADEFIRFCANLFRVMAALETFGAAELAKALEPEI